MSKKLTSICSPRKFQSLREIIRVFAKELITCKEKCRLLLTSMSCSSKDALRPTKLVLNCCKSFVTAKMRLSSGRKIFAQNKNVIGSMLRVSKKNSGL